MPQGTGTYGKKRGRPSKKRRKGPNKKKTKGSKKYAIMRGRKN